MKRFSVDRTYPMVGSAKMFGQFVGGALIGISVSPLSANEPLTIPVFSAREPAVSSASVSSTSDLPSDNAFAAPSVLPLHAPAFDRIKEEHYKPAFITGMQTQLDEMKAIADQADAPTFENTIVAMEKSGALLTRVRNVFSNLTSAHKSEGLQNIETELAPLQAAHADNIYLNKKLFARVEALWNGRAALKLTPEQAEVLKQHYENFVRAGARLNDEQQARIRSLNEQLSKLETRFEENLLAISKERSVIIDDVKELDGMSTADISAAAVAAKERGLEGKYLLQFENTTRVPLLSSLNNRQVRQKLWEASAQRGLGRDGGIDNRPLVLEISQLRAERAKLLGFEDHASYKLQNQMAETPAAARKMLADLVPGVKARVEVEARDLEAMIRESGQSHELAPWDWEYYAEKVRSARFEVDEAAVKPYFELESVLHNGVFFTMNRLYGITFRERKDLPVYHPDVRVFDVLDKDGSQLGLFYADYYKRDTKRGGAWMSNFVDQSGLLNEKPVIVNCLNIPRPAPGEPTLISFDNVTTLFHEMGHALHGMFSDCEYPSVSGTATPRDFVEFPSTFEEDWAIQPEILANYAKHYKTGEQIPKELLDKVIRASKFNQGFDTMEYLAAALLDLEWHSLTSEEIPTDVEQFETAALSKVGVSLSAVPPRYRTAYFAHIWSGGYSSSYYAYLWSEVLAADAFAHMMANGGCTSANGELFRKEILSRGSSRDPMESYKAFRGSKPTVDALLKRRGLK
ncbi:MAG: M3 family metallopeptidase [Planctomycetota bacterium]